MFAFFYLPKSAAEASFLTEEEREIAFQRIQQDSSSIVNEPFVLKDALKIFTLPAAYAWLGIEICLGVPIQSVALFLPQIIGRLGYDTIKTNLYTVAPNCVGAVFLLILAFSSDYARIRFPFILLRFLLTFIGFIIYATIDVKKQLHIAYFACFMMTWGTSAPSMLLSTWYNNNIAHEGRRIALTSLGVPLANLMGLVSSKMQILQQHQQQQQAGHGQMARPSSSASFPHPRMPQGQLQPPSTPPPGQQGQGQGQQLHAPQPQMGAMGPPSSIPPRPPTAASQQGHGMHAPHGYQHGGPFPSPSLRPGTAGSRPGTAQSQGQPQGQAQTAQPDGPAAPMPVPHGSIPPSMSGGAPASGDEPVYRRARQ